MLKKGLVIGAAVVLLLGLFFGRDAASYVRASVDKVHRTVKDSVPVEFEIERARKEIEALQPEIKKNKHLIAREEAAVARLEREVTRSEEQLAKDQSDIFRLKADLDSGTENFRYGDRTYTVSQVRTDLKNRFTHFRTSESKLDSLQKILLARQSGLKAAQEKLQAMMAAKRQLEVEVENLEAQLKMIEVAKTTSEMNFDDSQLSRTRELINEIKTRLEVEQSLANAEPTYTDRIPLDEPDSDQDISDEIAEYFGPKSDLLADAQK